MRKPDATIAESLQNMRKHLPTPEEPWNERWAIMLKGEGKGVRPKMIGVVGIVREVEIGYRLHPDYWGKGYMTEALTMFLAMWWDLDGTHFIFTTGCRCITSFLMDFVS